MNTSKPVRAGDSISIICRATIDRALVDVPVDIDFHLVSPKRMSKTQRFSSPQSLYQTSMNFSDISAEVSGNFTCNASVRASSTNLFLIPAHGRQIFDLILGKQ